MLSWKHYLPDPASLRLIVLPAAKRKRQMPYDRIKAAELALAR